MRRFRVINTLVLHGQRTARMLNQLTDQQLIQQQHLQHHNQREA